MNKKLNNDDSRSWSDLTQDLLLLIMLHFGVFDFIAFSGVCKPWRSVAVSNWNKFMVSKQPMKLSISTCLNQKDLYLEDYSRRKFKTTFPHSTGRDCVGVTCGYLIFYGEKTYDFWLVNPFTRKELHFPSFPMTKSTFPGCFMGILVFSPSMSGWVFVVSRICTNVVYFSLAGKQARWRSLSSESYVCDLHFFKGKTYMINTSNHLWELRLNSEPTMTLVEMENFPWPPGRNLKFVSSCENLYVRDVSSYLFQKFEADFDEMKWVNSERTIGEYTVFVNYFVKGSAAIKPSTWTHPWTQYKRLNHSQIDWSLVEDTWYYPHECLNDNVSDMENGAFLNILKE